MSTLVNGLKRFYKEEEAPTFVEYALAVVFIGLVAVVGALVLGQGLSTLFSDIGTEVGNQAPSLPTP